MSTEAALLTTLLYAAIALLAVVLLYRWHVDPRYTNFSVLDMISENGRLSSRKFMEFGAWAIASAAVVVSVIRGTLSNELLAIYLASFVAARSIGQLINSRGDVEIRKASIMKGGPVYTERRAEARSEPKAGDIELTVEEEALRREAERAKFKPQGR
jgi:hypothetical protein